MIKTQKHIIKEGSRRHVLSYSNKGVKCSEPNCEINMKQPQTQTPKEKAIDYIV